MATIKKLKSSPKMAKVKPRPIARTADNKGRVTLGERFANRHVIIEQIGETEVRVKMARVISESEAWLYDNAVALNSIRRGLAQARAGELVEGPDLAAGDTLADELED